MNKQKFKIGNTVVVIVPTLGFNIREGDIGIITGYDLHDVFYNEPVYYVKFKKLENQVLEPLKVRVWEIDKIE